MGANLAPGLSTCLGCDGPPMQQKTWPHSLLRTASALLAGLGSRSRGAQVLQDWGSVTKSSTICSASRRSFGVGTPTPPTSILWRS